jgi:hypothetical protein
VRLANGDNLPIDLDLLPRVLLAIALVASADSRRIEQLESEIAARTAAMTDPAFFAQDGSAIVQANKALVALQADLDAAYAQWAELDG